MSRLTIAYVIIITAIAVALTYVLFEAVVAHAIELVWKEWLDTDTYRLLIVPIVFGMTYIFFWLQHRFDRTAESKSEHGLGEMEQPTIGHFGRTLLIGFFSLLAGASLGPEAILVPASMILGSLLGNAFFPGDKRLTTLIAGAAIIALFTAFFHSFAVGLLSVFLVTKQAKLRLSPSLVGVSVIAAGTAYATLSVFPSRPFFKFPELSWSMTLTTLVWLVVLVGIGYGMVWLMQYVYQAFQRLHGYSWMKVWWKHATIAAAGLVIVYLLGGPLVQFTGNESIVPVLQQSTTLGIWGLVTILFIKIAAMSWSKAIGYRGGMIFPTILLVAIVYAAIHLYFPELNFIYALVATLVGAFIANRKSGILA